MDPLVAQLLEHTAQALAARPVRPEATYRLQFHAGFTFRDAARLVPYLHSLGVTHAYASPYLQARPGSQHGYDITDHRRLNPEIGAEADYAAWVAALQERGMAQILDIVPNHMAIATNDNAWWNDVLENGPASPFADFFDIEWNVTVRPEMRGRVLVPILGEPYAKALEGQQIRLSYEAGAFALNYFEHRFPIAPQTYALILGERLEELQRVLGADSPAFIEYQSILTAVKNLPPRTETDAAKLAERQREKEVVKRRLATLTADNASVAEFLQDTVALVNGKPGEPRSFDLLEKLLDAQVYRLAFWRVAADEINYRRFFDVNELAALSMERPEVFAATHELILRLLAQGHISGVRVDHIDGLFDPAEYLHRLQEEYWIGCARVVFETRPEYRGMEWNEIAGEIRAAVSRAAAPQAQAAEGERSKAENGRPIAPEDNGSKKNGQASAAAVQRSAEKLPPANFRLYVVVEKILTGDEALPEDWPIAGTTGYEFLNAVNGLFVDGEFADAFTRLYADLLHDGTPPDEIAYDKRILILQIALSSELQMLTYQLGRLAHRQRWSRDFTMQTLRRCLRAVIANFPVYRSYVAGGVVHDSDRKAILRAIRRAGYRNPALSTPAFNFIRDLLLLRHAETAPGDAQLEADQRRFAGKFQQVTAPVMAKGVEDTAFYVYNRLLSLNEVGGSPEQFGIPPEALHRFLLDRQAHWPYGLSATSTHDTKRSEDVRARLNVLSELPAEWSECVIRWRRMNQPHRTELEDAKAPDANEEYLLYQTLIGAWPMEPHAPEEYPQFIARMQAFMRKALHEAKVHTSWINPNTAYDEAVQNFVARILDPQSGADFLQDLRPFQRRISHYGMYNSLAQLLLKIAAPGVPDIYQGTELWDFSLVDPDNRRPVDYRRRQEMLEQLERRLRSSRVDWAEFAQELWANRADGRVKMLITWRALTCRRTQAGLFTSGAYEPLPVRGPMAPHVFTFLRRRGTACALVAVPRLVTRLAPPDDRTLWIPDVWQDTAIELPAGLGARRWRNVLTGASLGSPSSSDRTMFLPVADLFLHLPVALLLSEA